jgi:hypothetical protein
LYSSEINSVEARSGPRAVGHEPRLDQRQASGDLPNVAASKGKEKELPSSETPFGEPFDLLERLSKRSQNEGSDSGDEDGDTHKRPRLSESEMPWCREQRGVDVNPSCAKTVRLLKTFNRDIKQSRFYVTIAPGAPRNIPNSQWERILKGEPIDLDQILTSIHRVTIIEERKARIGETEISLGTVEAARKVTSSNDWSIAWRRAARATSYVFPHHRKELDEYTEYIEGEFEAKQVSAHYRVIHFDVAVRNLVCGGQQDLLTDTHKFQRLYSATMQPDGVENAAAAASRSRGSSATKSREICNRFNNGECRSLNCRYRHVCKTCGKPGHGKSTCPKKD